MNLPPIAELLPHAGRMVLLDRLIAVRPDHCVAEVTIQPHALFCDGMGVGGWVGIEYMAQTIAALAGWEARERGEPVKIGFLLGTRKYESHRPWFEVGMVLRIEATREFQADNGITVMHCRILDADGALCAEAAVSAFRPDNVEELLGET